MGMENKKIYTCPIDFTMNLIGSKWSMWILWTLHNNNGTLRFGEIKKSIPGITEKMLIQQLKKFESYGIVSRKVYSQIPPRVEYSLTEAGESLKPILLLVRQWGEGHLNMQ